MIAQIEAKKLQLQDAAEIPGQNYMNIYMFLT